VRGGSHNDPEGEVFVARRDRIERFRPTFVEVTAPTFDE
jgi:hypothetical protein